MVKRQTPEIPQFVVQTVKSHDVPELILCKFPICFSPPFVSKYAKMSHITLLLINTASFHLTAHLKSIQVNSSHL